MFNNGKPGGATPLAKALISIALAGALIALAAWWVNRPKVTAPEQNPVVQQPQTTTSASSATEPVRSEPPTATPALAAPQQSATTGSDDPYANLSTKDKEKK